MIAPNAPFPETPEETPNEPPRPVEKYGDNKTQEKKPEGNTPTPPLKPIGDLDFIPTVAIIIIAVVIAMIAFLLIIRKR